MVSVTLLDVMPTGDNRSDVVRMVTGIEGTVRMRHQWVVRLDYGLIIPWVRRREIHGEEAITAVAGPDKLVLRGPRLPIGDKHRHVDEFDVAAGESLTFSMTWVPSYERTPPNADAPILATIADDREWAARCHDDVPHVDVVRRSLLTLRLMTHEQTGGIVASPTTSLPEDFGGERNWDYRYCWLRDAALTIESLIDAGYIDEAGFWRHWLLRAVAGDPDDLQIMYAVDGSRHLPEHTLDHLPGYEGSRPVRIGNGAVEQKQTDVLGEVMVALVRRPCGRPGQRRGLLGPAAQPRQPAGGDLAGARPRAVGDPWPAAPLHALARDGLGGLRPGGPRRRGRGHGGTRRPLARGRATRSARS